MCKRGTCPECREIAALIGHNPITDDRYRGHHRRHRGRPTLGAWVLRYKVDLAIVAVGVGCWSWAVYGYTH